MFDQQLRTLKERIFAPFAKRLLVHVHPLLLSIIAFVCGLGACWALYSGLNLTALILWIISRIIDGFDGTVARVHHKKSAIGGYLDLMFDSIVYALFPISIAFASRNAMLYMAVLLLLGAYYFNVLSWTLLATLLEQAQNKKGDKRLNGAKKQLTSMRMPTGLIEGFETVVIYSLLCILPDYRLHIILIAAVLTTISGIGRIVWAIAKRHALES